jgi:hypothetical protein
LWVASTTKSFPYTVIYDPDAVVELVTSVKSKEERNAIFNAASKLRDLGEQLMPPHMKPLQGRDAAGLRELRPRRGDSDWRAVYRRFGDVYVILAVDRYDQFRGAGWAWSGPRVSVRRTTP